jgi:glycosyltransferase involved in cell wall biosynthesis
MKIILIASLTRDTTASYLVDSLRSLGHTLLVCSDVYHSAADVICGELVDVFEISESENFVPEAIFFIEGGSHRIIPVSLEKLSCLSLWYGIDTHMNYAKHLAVGALFDLTLIAQKQYVNALKKDGLHNVDWLPLGFPHRLLPTLDRERNIDVAYVGSTNWDVNHERYDLLDTLKNHFDSVSFGRANPPEMIAIYSMAKIVFNKSINNDLNMRFFEAMGSGAVLVTDPIMGNGLEDLFVEEKHYFSYKNSEELIGLVKKLLTDEERMLQVGVEAKELILSKHTYDHRAEAIIEYIELSKKGDSAERKHHLEFYASLSMGLLGSSAIIAAKGISEIPTRGLRSVVKQVLYLIISTAGFFIRFIESVARRLRH